MKASIIFTRNSSLISRIIRYITKSEISHVSILLDTTLGDNLLLDVTFKGYKLIPLERFLSNGNEIIHIIKIEQDLSHGIKTIVRWLDRPYDYKGMLSFIWIFGKIFRRSLEHPMDNPNSLICSEVVTILLQKSNYPGSHKLIPKKTSPNDLYKFLQSNLKSF